ncbi:hypothetical protein FH5_02176 [Priestia endophytica]|nr:hypothetical protein FH5_02176 [Priestia endophytica]
MEKAGISPRDIFIDKQNGKNFNREQYQLMKRMMRKGDILYNHSLDRFGRNKEEILQEWNAITKEIEADIAVLDMPLLDTSQYKDSLGTFITDLVLQILSWMAEEERDRIRKHQREGIDVTLNLLVSLKLKLAKKSLFKIITNGGIRRLQVSRQ